MPTELRDEQHELLTYGEDTLVVFGTEDTGYLTLTPMGLSAGDSREGDVERVREDGRAFGIDYLSAKTATFEVGVLTDRAADPHRANLDAVNTLESVWRSEDLRSRANTVAILRARVAGRVTRAYGRPRRYEETPGVLTKKGYTPVLFDFAMADDRWYTDQWKVASCALAPPPDGGLVAPLVGPLTTTTPTAGPSAVNVAGTRSTWPVVTFHGPCTNPEIDFGTFVIGLDESVPSGMSITVDTRPWRRLVTRDDGANMAGALTWETPPMRKCLLPVGTYDATFRAIDQTGSSWCEVRWRDAYARP